VKTLGEALATVAPQAEQDESTLGKPAASGNVKMTTAAIAGKLQASSGPELFKAALAYFQLVKGQETASRNELLMEMKSVTSRYKPSFASNLSPSISRLMTTNEVNEPSAGRYTLVPEELEKLKKALK
jgi:hypothetical protein